MSSSRYNKRIKLVLEYVTKFKVYPLNLAYDYLFSSPYMKIDMTTANKAEFFGIRIKYRFENYNIN